MNFEINKRKGSDGFWITAGSSHKYLNKLGKLSGCACPGKTGSLLEMAKRKDTSWYSSLSNAINSIDRYAKANNLISYTISVNKEFGIYG